MKTMNFRSNLRICGIRCFQISLLSLLLCSHVLRAQYTARGLGMGTAYTATARGVHAQGWNPANLGLPDNSSFSMIFFGLDAGVWNNAYNKTHYDKYNGAHLTQQDIDDILAAIPDNGLTLDVLTHVRLMSFSIGRFALSIGTTVATHLQIAKSVFKIPLSGLEADEIYSFDDMDGVAQGIGYVGISWGQPIPVSFADAFAIGATARVYYGGAYAEIEEAAMTVDMSDYSFDLDGYFKANYSLPPADSNYTTDWISQDIGYGLDLGAAAQFGGKWTVSLCVANVLGTIPFKRGVKSASGEISGTDLSVMTFEEDLQDTTWTEDGIPFDAAIPPVLRLGAAFKEGSFLVTADYEQGLKRGAEFGTNPRFAVGTEWRGLGFLPLRMGMVLGGRVGFGTSFGFGFRPGGFVLDFAIMNRGFALPNQSKGMIVALELGIDVQKKRDRLMRVGDF